MIDIDFNSYLPPYRSLLNPNARYDYNTHSLVPISDNELKIINSNFRSWNNHDLTFQNHKSSKDSGSGFKMKYKSLLSDVSRSLSMRLNSPYLKSQISRSTLQYSSITKSPKLLSSSTDSKPQSNYVPKQFKHLPAEIIDFIFFLVDDKQDYKSCLYTSKLFYVFAKPYYYENLAFTSTYRLGQFVSYLRLNSEVGHYVKSIDLSGIQPGYDEDVEGDVEENAEGNGTVRFNNDTLDGGQTNGTEKVLAGWRDWKFKNNPLYTVHQSVSTALTKIASNSQVSTVSNKSSSSSKYSSTGKKFSKPFKYFKNRKRRHSISSTDSKKSRKLSTQKTIPENSEPNQSILSRNASPHPLVNKYLFNYSSSKDVPVGYILHLIRLCPNIVSLNLGNLSLSMDYEISRSMIYKYQTFDVINNFPKSLVKKINELMCLDDWEEETFQEVSVFNLSTNNNNGDNFSAIHSINDSNASISIRNNLSGQFKQQNSSSASSVYSMANFTKPMLKYNSLLPPLPQSVNDILYLNKGDGKVYLSDLNLKAINNKYLRKLNEEEILSGIIKIHGHRSYRRSMPISYSIDECSYKPQLNYINLSSMIWLNKRAIQKFLREMICDSCGLSPSQNNDSNSDLDSIASEEAPTFNQDLIIDFTDSGMHKNLPWAKKIDLSTKEGSVLARKIIHDELYDRYEQYVRSERRRRGRMGENYLA